MPEQTAHPSEEKLTAYNQGLLSPNEAVAIETHISHCEPCCETVVGLSSDDTFVGLLKEARQLPVDQNLTHDCLGAKPSSYGGEIPLDLAKHPRYEIVRLIGKGGMGDVYEARHRRMERRVALKVINRQLFQKVEAVNRFHREVKTAAQLSHPNIVTAFDADQAGDHHFMVMEYVDGVDLSQIVKDQGRLPIAEACDYIRQAAIGLQHANELGMVHRDIKPHNLMVTADGIIKILDFGLASLTPEAVPATDSVAVRSDLTAAGAIMGTPDFISPEQASDARQVDIRSDIYSLGATLYYLLSGRVPFDDGSVMHKLKSHAQIEPESLTTLRDDVSEELVAIVSRMMAKDPNERYLTPSEVAGALESFLRTWRPEEIESLGHEPASGGNMSSSGEKKVDSGDMSSDWLSLWAKWLFYISLIPIAVFILDVFCLSEEASVAAADRALYYLITSVVLSTVAGVLSGLHAFQSETNRRSDHPFFRLTSHQTLIIAAILVGAVMYFYTQSNTGVVRIEVVPHEDTTTLGTHPLTIIDTSGKKPFGGTSGTHQDDSAGITTHSFESANGRYKITLVNDVLTVNGDNYSLDNPNDTIRIVDDRVEITRVEERPKNVDPLRPNVNVASYRAENGHHWQLVTQKVEAVRIRLLRIANGKVEVASESVLRADGNDTSTIDLTLLLSEVKDEPESMSTTIEIASDDMQFSRSQTGPLTVSGTFQTTPVVTSGNLAWNQPSILYHLADWSGDLAYSRSIESMIEASRDNSKFVALEVEWVAEGEMTVPEWFAQARPTVDQDDPQLDLDAIQGTWRVIFAEDSGRTSPSEALRDIRIAIVSDTLTMDVAGRKVVSTYKLDPSTEPKSIDLTTDGRTKPGIYDLQGDTLRICTSENTDKRPTAFDSQPDSVNDVVLTMKRVKQGETASEKSEELRHDGPLTTKLARVLIPQAASISNQDFQKLQSNPSHESIESKSLSLVILTLDIKEQSPENASEFKILVDGVPKPSDLARAMSLSRSKGYFSIIQPEYISGCAITNSTETTAAGKVTFNAPQLYIGTMNFEARKNEGKWSIDKFQLPSRQISVILGEDGQWHRESAEE